MNQAGPGLCSRGASLWCTDRQADDETNKTFAGVLSTSGERSLAFCYNRRVRPTYWGFGVVLSSHLQGEEVWQRGRPARRPSGGQEQAVPGNEDRGPDVHDRRGQVAKGLSLGSLRSESWEALEGFLFSVLLKKIV